ncbi:MAG: PHP domain-containing protein [Lachnospiraceae bacterium]|nr:PHP domain-containing protein [Lachnospiraceae bacterium]
MRADLHIHSIYSSDGTYTPSEVVDLCRSAELDLIALTDHNSARGVREAQERAEKLGIQVLPGVELDCVCRGTSLHLLGYGIDVDREELHQAEDQVLRMEQEVSEKKIELVKRLGIYFDEQEVWEHSWNRVVTAEMIGESALKDERNKEHPLVRPLYPGGLRSDNPFVNFYWDICSPGKPAFVPVEYMAFEQAQKLITDLGGISVIAHPGQTVKKDRELIGYMKELGVKGIEVYSSYHTEEQVLYYEKVADSLSLLRTPGSDFHGKTKPAVTLRGVSGKNVERDVETLLECLK